MKSTNISQPAAERPGALLQPSTPEKLRREMQPVQLAIARRAFELFEHRNREHRHDSEDWFRAESELLRPVSIMIHESAERLILQANVFGFTEKELLVSIEPKRVAILGRKEIAAEGVGGKVDCSDWYPDQILRVIDLPIEVGAIIGGLTGKLLLPTPEDRPGSTRKEAPLSPLNLGRIHPEATAVRSGGIYVS